MNIHIIKILSILITTIIFIYLLYPKINEGFITWYLPFYNKATIELTKGTPKYLTSKLEYDLLEYEYIDKINFYLLKKTSAEKNEYYKFILSNIVKSLKVEKLITHYESYYPKLLKQINDKKNNFGIISSQMLVDKMSSDINLVQYINIVCVSNYRYIFFIINKASQISSLLEMNNKRINIGKKDTDDYLFGTDIVNNLKINNTLSIKPSYFDTEEAFKKLIKNEIDGMFFTDLYPSDTLDKYIINDIEKKLILIPITQINQSVFKQRNIFVEPVGLDLNALPPNYLPIKVKKLEHTKFRPIIESFRYPDFIVCNQFTDPKISFGVVNSFVSNIDIINRTEFFTKNGYNYLAFPGLANSMFLPTHIGAKIFYNKITISSTKPDTMCKYYVGKSKCNDEKIEGAKIIMGLDGDED